ALAGAQAALVSPEPGTTRDYLMHRLELGGATVELVDTAGWRGGNGNGIEREAEPLGREQAEGADPGLLCLEAGRTADAAERALWRQAAPPVLAVATKCDRAAPPADLLATSAVTRAGLSELRERLAERARAHRRPALAPSLSRCRHHVETCLAH